MQTSHRFFFSFEKKRLHICLHHIFGAEPTLSWDNERFGTDDCVHLTRNGPGAIVLSICVLCGKKPARRVRGVCGSCSLGVRIFTGWDDAAGEALE